MNKFILTHRRGKSSKGFTTIELVVVLMVIAFLLCALAWQFLPQLIHKAKATACTANLDKVNTAYCLALVESRAPSSVDTLKGLTAKQKVCPEDEGGAYTLPADSESFPECPNVDAYHDEYGGHSLEEATSEG